MPAFRWSEKKYIFFWETGKLNTASEKYVVAVRSKGRDHGVGAVAMAPPSAAEAKPPPERQASKHL